MVPFCPIPPKTRKPMPFEPCLFFPAFQIRFFFVCGLNKPNIEEMRRLKTRAAALHHAGIRINSILCSENPVNVGQALTVYQEIGGDGAKLSTSPKLTDFNLYPLQEVNMRVVEAAAQASGLPPEVYMMTIPEYNEIMWRVGMSAAHAVANHMSYLRPGVTVLVCTHQGRIDTMLRDLTSNYPEQQQVKPGHFVQLVMVRDTRQVLYREYLTDDMLGVNEIDLPS